MYACLSCILLAGRPKTRTGRDVVQGHETGWRWISQLSVSPPFLWGSKVLMSSQFKFDASRGAAWGPPGEREQSL